MPQRRRRGGQSIAEVNEGTHERQPRHHDRGPGVSPANGLRATSFMPVGAGYCGKTMDGLRGECDEFGQKGSLFPIKEWTNREAAFAECAALCLQCGRCRFVSFSTRYRDCSWFHTCPAPLKTDLRGFMTYQHNRSHLPSAQRLQRAHKKAPSAKRYSLLIRAENGTRPTWPWLSPTAHMRLAIVLFGKIGTLEDPSSYVKDAHADARVVRLAADSLRRHVIRANPEASCDLFIHSWNPSLAPIINKLYAPTHSGAGKLWSHHQPEIHQQVVSSMTSLAAALAARRAHEASTGHPYNLVLAARHDLIWYTPLVLARLPRAQLWLPAQCCRPDAGRDGEMPEGFEDAIRAKNEECLGDERGVLNAVCTTSRFLRFTSTDRDMAREAEFNYYVNDWMFIAPSATADTFGQIAERHRAYADALSEVGIYLNWLHFYWAAHVHHALHVSAGVRPALEVGTEFQLVRHAVSGRYCRTSARVANESTLPMVRPPVWGGMAKALCTRAGMVNCPWSSHRCASALEGESLTMG